MQISPLKNLRKQPGETLLEALIAVSMLLIILTPASGMYINSSRTIGLNRNDLVAVNLAEEGIEVMRNFRDTNLLRFSPKSAECWNTRQDPAITLDNCAEKKIVSQMGEYRNFRLAFDPDTLEWALEEVVDDSFLEKMSLALKQKEYALRLDVLTDQNPECQDQINRENCSAHAGFYFAAAQNSPLEKRGEATEFYRQVRIRFIDEGTMKATSVVQYKREGGYRTIVRNVIITKP